MCIYLHHLSHICTTLRNGPFWILAGAVLVLFFLPLGPFWSGPFWFAWAVFDLHWGRFGDGPFWSVPHLGRQRLGLFGNIFFAPLNSSRTWTVCVKICCRSDTDPQQLI